MKTAKQIWTSLSENIERWIVIGSYIYFCGIILVEVIRRYVFGNSSDWGGMTARYAFILLVYVAMAEVARNRNHIRVDLIPSLLAPKGRLILYLYFDLLHLILVGLVCYFSIKVMHLLIVNDVLMSSADLNMVYAQAALPIGWSLLGIRVIQRSVQMVRKYQLTGTVDLQGEGVDE